MSDMFFEDKRKQPNNDIKTNTPESETEEFNLTFKRRQTSQVYERAEVNPSGRRINGEAVDVYSQQSARSARASSAQNKETPRTQSAAAPQAQRMPQGQRPPQNRAPQGQSVQNQSRVPQGQRVAQNRAPQAQSRTPQGRRVPSPQNPVNRQQPQGVRKTPRYKPPQKKDLPVKKIAILGVVAAVLIFVIALFGYGYSALSGLTHTEIEDKNAYIDESTLMSDSDVKNILFIGSDEREGLGGQRSDSMILFSIDSKNKQIKLTSFMRDSYVYIPSKNYNTKLNAAFNYGGAQLLIDTIEYNFHVKIDDFIMVDYNAFKQFINLLGGITVDGVTAKEAEYMRVQVNIPEIQEGTNKMNGRAAMWYCRIRYVDDDFHRTQRQRKVITAIVAKAAKTNIFKLIDICKEILPNISTNFERSDLMSLAVGALFKYLRYDIVQQQIPAPGTWSNAKVSGQAVLKMNLEENRTILKNFIYSEKPIETTEK